MHTLHTTLTHAARLVLIGLAAALALLGAAGTAGAHPFGTPPVAQVRAEGRTVDITWSAQQDDLDVLHQAAKGNEAAYLGSHITVHQDGRACRFGAVDTARLASKGALIHYTCPEPVDTVALTITALTDVNPAYRTISVTKKGGGGLHTASDPTLTLALGECAPPPPHPRRRRPCGPRTLKHCWTTASYCRWPFSSRQQWAPSTPAPPATGSHSRPDTS